MNCTIFLCMYFCSGFWIRYEFPNWFVSVEVPFSCPMTAILMFGLITKSLTRLQWSAITPVTWSTSPKKRQTNCVSYWKWNKGISRETWRKCPAIKDSVSCVEVRLYYFLWLYQWTSVLHQLRRCQTQGTKIRASYLAVNQNKKYTDVI